VAAVAAACTAVAVEVDLSRLQPKYWHKAMAYLSHMIAVVVYDSVIRNKNCSKLFHWIAVVYHTVVRSYLIVAAADVTHSVKEAAAAVASEVPMVEPGTVREVVEGDLEPTAGEAEEVAVEEAFPSGLRPWTDVEARRGLMDFHYCFGNH